MGLPNIINEINTIKSTYLPLSGGIMTGNINWNRGVVRQNGHSFEFVGDKDLPNQTSFIACRSALHPSESGWFYFGARNKESGYMGICKPDGTFTWGGNNVITSKGGTINGVLRITSPRAIEGSSDNNYLVIAATANDAYKNSSIFLHNINATDNAGCFQFRASDGTNTKLLHGSPTGTLTWNNKNVVCVTTWNSGTQWYRKYADGFIEQGGVHKQTWTGSDYGWVTITFVTNFINKPLTLLTRQTGNSNYVANYHQFIKNVTTSSFSTAWQGGGMAGATGIEIYWYACGF